MKTAKKVLSIALAAAMLITGLQVSSEAAKTKVSTKKLSVSVGSSKTIKISAKKKICKYTFKSSKTAVAKVSSKGVVTGKKIGKAVITVKEVVKKTKKAKVLGKVNVTVTKKTGKTQDASKQTEAPTVTAPAGELTPEPTEAPTPEPTVNVSFDFSDKDLSMCAPQGDGVMIEIDADGYNDDACLKATGRNKRDEWSGCGPAIEVSKIVKPGKTYKVKCYVKSPQNATITLKSVNVVEGGSNNGWGNRPAQVGESIEVKSGQWAYMEVIYAAPDAINNKINLFWDANNTADLYVDSVEIVSEEVFDDTFKTLFTDMFGHVGTCNTLTQMRNNKSFTTSLYNSVTMENETKPQSFINERNVSNTVPEGYIIPDSYKDTKYPVLSFQNFDDVIETAYEFGLQIRFHVLVWHSQTPGFFFKKNYDNSQSYVTKDVMEGRMEYYIRNVINHIYNTPHGKDVVYCIDVVNEYFHNYDSGRKSNWNAVYYPDEKSQSDRTNKPEYVKRAFEITYDELEKFDLAGKVKLFYNDYNTYEVVSDIITLINYVNSDRKVCDGVGMQSHLAVNYPSPKLNSAGEKPMIDQQKMTIAQAIDAFASQDFEIQITELDVTDYDNTGAQVQYYKDLFTTIITKKKNGANITGVTFWGLCDTNSWRGSGKPLLFSAVFTPKPVFFEVINTAKELWQQ